LNYNLKNFDLSEKNLNDEVILKLNQYKSSKKEQIRVNKKDVLNTNFSLISETFKNSRNERFFIKNNEPFTIGMLSLAPHTLSSYNTCIYAGTCKEFCLGANSLDENFKTFSDGLQLYRKTLRTVAFFENPKKFMEILCLDIVDFIKKNKNPVIRLNGYSDIIWEEEKFTLEDKILTKIKNQTTSLFPLYSNEVCEKYKLDIDDNKINTNLGEKYNIFELFSGILFYDYTKYTPEKRFYKYKNYHLVYSYDSNIDNYIKRKENKFNKDICIIVKKELKKIILERKELFSNSIILNGDDYDCRILDNKVRENQCPLIILLEAVSPNNKYKSRKLDDSRYVFDDIEDFQNIFKMLKIKN